MERLDQVDCGALPDQAVELAMDDNADTSVNRSTMEPPKKRLGQIYAHPMPLTCHPLPAFIPHNPLSILRIAFALLSGFTKDFSSHPPQPYKGIFSAETQSVHVTNPMFIRDLWEKGFFGKGTLSRSDPSWLDREKRRRGQAAEQTSEEFTQSRRDERRQMKFERALKERETIENQLLQESRTRDLPGSIGSSSDAVLNGATHDVLPVNSQTRMENVPRDTNLLGALANGILSQHDSKGATDSKSNVAEGDSEVPNQAVFGEVIEDQEHLQLSPEEALFLTFGLGVLEVYEESSISPLSTIELFHKLRLAPSCTTSSSIQTDDLFILKYVVYHHFRSLGWVLRGGSKFSVDYLLYNRGPVFSHAEYAVLIVPSYSHPYWADPSREAEIQKKEKREWHWLHCINRVQAHVHKTLVLAYVDIPPPPLECEQGIEYTSIGSILGRYKVREFVIRRWLINRSRD